jgi:hypothetical protein
MRKHAPMSEAEAGLQRLSWTQLQLFLDSAATFLTALGPFQLSSARRQLLPDICIRWIRRRSVVANARRCQTLDGFMDLSALTKPEAGCAVSYLTEANAALTRRGLFPCASLLK